MKNRTWLGVAIALALLTLPAWAAIPSAQKIAKAVAETNETSGRGGALLLEVQLRIQGREGPPAAQGVIATHPTGLARLELKSSQGFVERHLLQSDAYQASRDGELLARRAPPLPAARSSCSRPPAPRPCAPPCAATGCRSRRWCSAAWATATATCSVAG